MYWVNRGSRQVLESDACGIGFVATRKGVADRQVVEHGLELCKRFDHRGAPGHGAGVQVDIPWPLLLDRFPEHAKLIAQRDVALGMFFLPFDPALRRRCVEKVEELAKLGGASVLQWANVPIDENALEPGSSARRTMPIVRQALFKRPDGLSEEGWFVCRYLLRLALDQAIGQLAGDDFSVVSLSNRTVIYKGLFTLSRIGEFYPDLQDASFASRFLLFHSRYCTNTTTAWRRAQPFWALAHNGEINTISGNVAWFEAIGRDLLASLAERHPSLGALAANVSSVICSGGSDTANLDDMLIALLAGGMSVTQSLLALLPESQSVIDPSSKLAGFYRAMSVYLGACDGPAALVACDGDDAVAHLDRNGLRPLWFATTKDFAIAASELTGTLPGGEVEVQQLLGPGETVKVRLANGMVYLNEEVQQDLARESYPGLGDRLVEGGTAEHGADLDEDGIYNAQVAFGMTREDADVLLKPLFETGKPAVGSMGDDTSPAAMLDRLPRRLEDHFALRFAQETSPPIDPIRDAWVFDSSVALGDRSGLFGSRGRNAFAFANRVLSQAEAAWVREQSESAAIDLTFNAAEGPTGIENGLIKIVDRAIELARNHSVLVLSDQTVGKDRAPLPALRAVSRLHQELVRLGIRHRVGVLVEAGVWDIQHVALLVAMGADAVNPWLGSVTAGTAEATYLKGLRAGFTEAMSMMGVTPSSAYCGAGLVESIGLDAGFVAAEFPRVPAHLGGIGPEILDQEWFSFWASAYTARSESVHAVVNVSEPALVASAGSSAPAPQVRTARGEHALVDAGEFRHTKDGRPHANNAEIVRLLHSASGYSKKIHQSPPGSYQAYKDYSGLVSGRDPITVLDLLKLKPGVAIPIDEVESIESIAWRFMAPGMSEGALSEPSHRTIAQAMNVLRRYCRLHMAAKGEARPGYGPFANSGEGGFDKGRIGKRDGNTSVQYAGGRFTITPMTASRAPEAEVKFAQGAKPGKGGQLPGKKVSVEVALRRGCEPGYELVSPPINHNLYSIEDVKLMLESWRHLNPKVNCALKYVATHGVEMVAIGGVHAGANRLHLSDGCGGTGAAKRVDQKHAGVPVAAVLPTVQDMLVEEGVRHLVELSVDGGVQNGEQALKLFLLGADRVGFGTSLLIAIGCSMLRKCHLAGPDPADPTGKRRLGCTPGVATQDPAHVAKFAGKSKHICRYLLFVAQEIQETMAQHGIRRLEEVIGRRDLLTRKDDLVGKASLIDLGKILNAPHGSVSRRDYRKQSADHMPVLREQERAMAGRALEGDHSILRESLTNEDRCVGVGAAGQIARRAGDLGLPHGSVTFEHKGAAGHFYAAYAVEGMNFRLRGLAADSCFTAAYGGTLAIFPPNGDGSLTVVGNAFGYGARGGKAFIAGRGGNRFGICLRKNAEGTGPTIVVEGVAANAFQYMTGGTALVLGSTGTNLGSGMTGGAIYLLDFDESTLNRDYVQASPVGAEDLPVIEAMLGEHLERTGSARAAELLKGLDSSRFVRVATRLAPEKIE